MRGCELTRPGTFLALGDEDEAGRDLRFRVDNLRLLLELYLADVTICLDMFEAATRAGPLAPGPAGLNRDREAVRLWMVDHWLTLGLPAVTPEDATQPG